MMDGKGFAVWITGLPGSGKSTLSRLVQEKLEKRGVRVRILESDELRRELTSHSTYDKRERELFYNTLVYLGKSLVENGINVIFDATANRRRFRQKAREEMEKFMEVYLRCPLEVCMSRDPKGIYKKARKGETSTVPGAQTVYEEPLHPEVVVDTDRETPTEAGERIFQKIWEKFA